MNRLFTILVALMVVISFSVVAFAEKSAKKEKVQTHEVEAKLKELGFELPAVSAPVAAYIPAVKAGKLVFTAGQIPMVKGELKFKGKVGRDLTEQQGYESAQICVLNALAAIKSVAGSLDNIERVVKVVGFVNSVPEFTAQAKVINGASELLGKLFGEKGKHARSAVGVNVLPLDSATEVELIVELKRAR